MTARRLSKQLKKLRCQEILRRGFFGRAEAA